MAINALLQVGIFLLLVALVTVPLGAYMTKVFSGEPTFLDRVVGPLERLIYRICGVHPENEMTWFEYTADMLVFSLVGMIVLYALERFQGVLPLNPQGFGGGSSCSRLQYRRELHHQHQLASLQWRNHDELSDADGGAGVSQLRLGGSRHRDSYRDYPRLCASHAPRHSATSGWM